MNTRFGLSSIMPNDRERRLLSSAAGEEAPDDAESHRRLFARLAWARLCEPGDRVAGQLVSILGSDEALLEVLAGSSAAKLFQRCQDVTGDDTPTVAEIRAGLQRWRPRLDRAATEHDLIQAAENGMRLLTPGAVAWPSQLNDLEAHAPLVLWVRGDASLLRQQALSVVGARACTAYGQQVTADFVGAAVSAERAIVSGAAYGIDGVAHRAALSAGGGTVAILAGGADRFYPVAHSSLLSRIIERGAVISEMVPGASPTRWRFLMRNRLIAALSTATLVTEAGVRSGSLNTAGHAAELGRSIGAVPGPVTAASSFGCFRILEEYGAMMVTKHEDVLALIGAESDVRAGASAEPRERSLHHRVIDALPLKGTRTAAAVAKAAGITVREAVTALTELQYLGRVQRHGDGALEEALWSIGATGEGR